MTRMQGHFKQEKTSPQIDLHCHSTHSDGTLSPSELVELAGTVGLRGIALTDHDTVSGLEEFLAADASEGLVRLGGVEISSRDGGRILHIVGLGVDPANGPLLALLSQIREWRRERNRTMVQRLGEIGLPTGDGDMASMVEQVDVLGRPHLAAMLVKAGVCSSNRQAFAKYLGRGKPGYVPRQVCELDEAIQAIRRAGGIAIWAHPLTSGSLTVVKFERLLRDYADRGLDGVEAYYSEFSAHQTRVVEQAASRAGVLLSGGSDFHGAHIPDIAMGTGYGSLHVPEEVLSAVQERIAERREDAASE
jgi:predicted metal-dependent phosphoesterase TrpH